MFKYQKLGKFTYHIIRDLNDIKPFLLRWIEKEWKIDYNEFPDQKWTREWLNLLPKMKFQLQIVDLDNGYFIAVNIQNNPTFMILESIGDWSYGRKI